MCLNNQTVKTKQIAGLKKGQGEKRGRSGVWWPLDPFVGMTSDIPLRCRNWGNMKITIAMKMELSVKWHILGRRGSRKGGKGKKKRGKEEEEGRPQARENKWGRLCSQAFGKLWKKHEAMKR